MSREGSLDIDDVFEKKEGMEKEKEEEQRRYDRLRYRDVPHLFQNFHGVLSRVSTKSKSIDFRLKVEEQIRQTLSVQDGRPKVSDL